MKTLADQTAPLGIKNLPGQIEFGFRGMGRLAKTLREVYPRAARLLLARRKPQARDVRELFEAMGVTYIKLGQFIASAPSIFPADYVEEFQHCLDNTPQLDFDTVKKIVEKELGSSLEHLYASFDAKPLASASIAQVHAATLHSGQSVVVKVQKPDVGNIIATDLNVVFVMSRLMELVTPGLSRDAIAGFVSEIYQYMIDECDFNKEATNLVEFQQFLAANSIVDVTVPKPYDQLCSTKVLTMERFYGVSLTDMDVLADRKPEAAEALLEAVNTWFASIRGCDFFHADLHSGNLMLLDDGRVGFIDFGMIGRIDDKVWQAAFRLLAGLNRQDANEVAIAMTTIGMTALEVDVEQLADDIYQLFKQLDSSGFSDAGSSGEVIEGAINNLLVDLGQLARRHGLRFPHAFTLLIKQLLYFDKTIRLLMPGLDLFGNERIDI